MMEIKLEEEDTWICPNCGSKMEKLKNNPVICHVCPQCGCTIEGKEQNFDTESICPNCYQPMGDSSECSYCGYDLGSDFD